MPKVEAIRIRRKKQKRYKPGYVPKKSGVCHLSTPPVARRLKQPTPRQWTSNP